jgi:hypothetical protein
MNNFAEQGSHAADWLIDTARRKPEALLLLAAGCALLARAGRSNGRHRRRPSDYPPPDWAPPQSQFEREQEARNGLRQAGNYASDLGGRVSDTAGSYVAAAGSYASDIRDQVSDAAGSYARTVADYADGARRSVSQGSQRLYRQAQDTVPRLVREQPFLVAGLGLAAGVAVAAAFPPTSIEQRAAGDARDRIADAAGNVRDNLWQAAGKAGDSLKQRMSAGGLDTSGLREMAREVVAEITGGGQDQGGQQQGGQQQGRQQQGGAANGASGSPNAGYGSSAAASAHPSDPHPAKPEHH